MKFIYFDVGGVLVRDLSDTNEWSLLLDEWGLVGENRQKFNKFFNSFEEKLNIGNGIEDFSKIMEKRFGVELPKNYSLSNELVDRFFCQNKKMMEIIGKIRDSYKLGLLTNMYKGMLDLIRKKKLIPDVYWSVIVDSSIEKCKKPEGKIYEIAQERSKMDINEILFVDNKKENLEIPKKMGWQTFWFDSSNYERSNKELESFLR